MSTDKTTLIIDCHNICYASLFKMGDLSYQGQPTGMVYGFLRKIFSLCKEYDTNQIIYCWDSRKSYRKRIYPEYKGNRHSNHTEEEKEMFDYAHSQMDTLHNTILPELGFRNNFHAIGYEADDLIALCAMRHPDNYVIVSGDSDLYQLLYKSRSYEVKIHNPRTNKEFTVNDFWKVFGIMPDKWALCKAIGGCDTDNVKGIRGVSDPAKSETSKALLWAKGLLEKGKIYDSIISKEGQEIISRNMMLVALPFIKDKELKIEIQNEELHEGDFLDVFRELGFRSFRKEFSEWCETFQLNKGRRNDR
jgi:5'-3' exonuclease